MAMEQQVLLRLVQESLQPVQESRWLLHKQRPILRSQACHKPAFRMPGFRKLVRHMLARRNHILAEGSSALGALTSASSALAMKA
ncbi:MAG: hypothetical protein NT138_20350 [Planctomycetales bacterium]|nr:hypothetical protein [Planctomycetales bacterium]